MIKLLILEDNPEVRYGIYDHLKQNYEVFVTKDEKEVFRILNQTNIDLIIFDYSIISINLKQFVAALKTSNDKILTMILSDQLEDSDKKCLFQSDIDDYVNKPLDMLELQFRMEHLLKKQSNPYRKLIKTDDLTINCETNRVVYCANEYYINENTSRTYINDLRRKLDTIDELEIVTVRGIGYKGIIKNSNCY